MSLNGWKMAWLVGVIICPVSSQTSFSSHCLHSVSSNSGNHLGLDCFGLSNSARTVVTLDTTHFNSPLFFPILLLWIFKNSISLNFPVYNLQRLVFVGKMGFYYVVSSTI